MGLFSHTGPTVPRFRLLEELEGYEEDDIERALSQFQATHDLPSSLGIGECDRRRLDFLLRRRGQKIRYRRPRSAEDENKQAPLPAVLQSLQIGGCEDVTEQLSEQDLTEYPVSYGGYGDVYRGRLEDGTRIGLKCLRLQTSMTEEAEKHLQYAGHELYVWSKCSHPNILPLIGCAIYRGQLTMVSPWMEHGNLSGFLSKNPNVDRRKMCVQLADGIAYMHGQGVIHGDIKGANIMVSEDYTIKLADFGSSVLDVYGSLDFPVCHSELGRSLRWAAPELFDDEARLTPASDVYALGMTILEIVTGEPPYGGLRDVSVLSRVLKKLHPDRPPEAVPDNAEGDLLWSLLTRCWCFEPQKRPSAEDVRDQLALAHKNLNPG